MNEFEKNEGMVDDQEGAMEPAYEAQDYEPDCGTDEEAGLSTGGVIVLTSLATAGAIWLGKKAVKLVKRCFGKKADDAAEAEPEIESDSEPESETDSDYEEA